MVRHLFFIPLLFLGKAMADVPEEFISLQSYCPEIQVLTSYSTTENFTGSIVSGYLSPKCFLSKPAAKALCLVHKKASQLGLGVRVFDAYRPVKAVEFFMEWAKLPESNPDLKKKFYPQFTRKELFDAGYIARRSSHSRGSAVDLTLYNLENNVEIDMGGIFDLFDEVSHTSSPLVSSQQKQNRMILKTLMEGEGFKNFSLEWWHYSLIDEPFPGTYFDFDIK
jgi:D-alanyl-D-alanine dipeptidase